MAPRGMLTARDLAGTYTGVLQGVSVRTLDDLEYPERQVIVDLDLVHQVTIRETGPMTVTIQSSVIPPVRAIVVGSGPVAINAEVVALAGNALSVKQIVFVQYQGEWIVVLQLVKVGIQAENENVYVYQYVSYPARVARQMSEDGAIVYVNEILRLIYLRSSTKPGFARSRSGAAARNGAVRASATKITPRPTYSIASNGPMACTMRS